MARVITIGALSLLAIPLTQAAVLPNRQVQSSSFMDATCDVAQDIGKLSSTRWSDAQADAVLNFANRNWNEAAGSHGETNLGYIDTMFRLFGKPTANCGIAHGSCDFSSESCLDKSDLASGETQTVGKTPGAWAIRQSLSHLHSVR